MSTLAEIEAAVPDLSTPELEQLERTLREIRQQRAMAHPPTSTDLAEFAGSLCLTEDPLTFQRLIREEWE